MFINIYVYDPHDIKKQIQDSIYKKTMTFTSHEKTLRNFIILYFCNIILSFVNFFHIISNKPNI